MTMKQGVRAFHAYFSSCDPFTFVKCGRKTEVVLNRCAVFFFFFLKNGNAMLSANSSYARRTVLFAPFVVAAVNSLVPKIGLFIIHH